MRSLNLTLLVFLSVFVRPISASPIGYSGMEQITPDSYLVVMDKKVYEDGDRVGILNTKEGGGLEFSPLNIQNWKHSDGQASDLESVCSIPGKNNEFLLAEAGYWEGKYGRIFHIEINAKNTLVKNVFRIPKIVGSKDGVDGDNFEGMVCLEKDDSILVILGERGGSSLYRDGYLRIGILDYSNASLSWEKYANQSIKIESPGDWNDAKSKRSISDLYLDKSGIIWAVATDDAGDEGPFKSIIYKAAVISSETDNAPILAIKSKEPQWVVDGFKVEALAGPSSAVSGSFMCIGTEDESYGGVWRPLFNVVK